MFVGSDVIQVDWSGDDIDIGWLYVTSKKVVSTSVAIVEQEFSPSKWSDKARNESAEWEKTH